MIQQTLKIFFAVIFIIMQFSADAQGYLHRSGKNILDGEGNNFLIRSIGTGNWMIQEGYMMKTSGVAGTQHEFREKLVAAIGQERTDSFYNAWLEYHFTRADMDSMKAWGFNTIRPALHYVWFTPPIEDEPVAGEITWLNKGFELLDSLLVWAAENEMYLILDMHGAPGGQGKDSNISDYDPSKPSLWESQANKDKLIALWRKIAERYSDEPWIGGYDLINEPNWEFSEPNNQPLWAIYQDITAAIREVDTNHLIFIEGNWFANDYAGLPTIWDDNLALSFHKYWTYNHENALDWMTNLQNERNVPLWLGESGENSNTWFTNLIGLCERNNIGWSWWPIKKAGVNNVMQVTVNPGYQKLIDSWRGEGPAPTADEAFNAVLQFAENHKAENCFIHYDVIDAMIRQPHTVATKPFKSQSTGEEIFFVNYDLGRNNYAYFDTDTANYHLETNEHVKWNIGYGYRNDGVDIESCNDNYLSNGYNVGWTEAGEWMQYTINVPEEAAYTLDIRSASGDNGSQLHIELDGSSISQNINLPATGGWQTWKTNTVNDIILPQGKISIRVFIDKAGSNLNYFKFSNPQPVTNANFVNLTAQTIDEHSIRLDLNKPVTQLETEQAKDDFTLLVNDEEQPISSVSISTFSDKVIVLKATEPLLYNQNIQLAFNGNSVLANEQTLTEFPNMQVVNHLIAHFDVPGKIEAEDFLVNEGLQVEECSDFNGGENLGYANRGDYVEYKVFVEQSGMYKVDYRLASNGSNGEFVLITLGENTMVPIDTQKVENTGGWQTWKTQTDELQLKKGLQTLRIYVESGEFNLNWFKFTFITGVKRSSTGDTGCILYPNPAKSQTTLYFGAVQKHTMVSLLDLHGKAVYSSIATDNKLVVNTSGYQPGIYFIKVTRENNHELLKLLIN